MKRMKNDPDMSEEYDFSGGIELFENPRHPYTRGPLESIPRLP